MIAILHVALHLDEIQRISAAGAMFFPLYVYIQIKLKFPTNGRPQEINMTMFC